ncbi:MAG: hypothetical protein KDB07_08730, partial [Planctomycetes bacterium]|nr:hypothetical protein [Planctomycetota bacterium]
VAGTGDRGLKIHDTSNWTEITTIVIPTDIERCARFLPDSSGLIVGYYTGDLRLWDTTTWTLMRTFDGPPGNDGVTGVDVSSDGLRVVSCDALFRVRVWDLITTQELAVSPSVRHPTAGSSSGSDAPNAIAISHDGQVIATTWRNDIVMLNASDASIRGWVLGHTSRPKSVRFSNDDNVLYSVSGDRTLRFWRK